MQDVADRAGVSAKTVSRVFRNEQHVSDAVRQRVSEAMRELNFVPNMLARTFREGKASVLGIAVPSIVDPFFAAIIEAVDTFAKDHDHAIAVTSLGSDPAREQPIVEALLLRQISSLIIAPIAPDQSYLMPWLSHKPIVFIDREPHGIDADVFLEDDYGGADLAVRHLMELGHRRIAFLGADDAVPTTSRRLEGFKAAYQVVGMPLDDSLILLAGPGLISEMLTRTLSGQAPPTAIFSSNSRTSIEIIPTLQQLGRTDLAMVGFGDFPMASALQPAVSVIDQNPSRLGRAAAERAVNRLGQSQATFERRTVFEVNLIRRTSSRPVASSQL
jgi:LacI family transcriptional regulator